MMNKTERAETTEKVERMLANLPNLSTIDLASLLYMVRLLEPRSDRSVLIAKIRDELKTCRNFGMLITMYKMIIERAHQRSIKKMVDHVR